MSTDPTTEPKSSLKPLIIVLGVVLVAVVVLTFLWSDKQPPEGKRPGNLCPEIAGFDVDGKPLKLSDYRGKVVLVSFWATWCPPCRQQLPHEREMATVKYANRPFTILGVAQDGAERLKDFFRTEPLPWPNIADDHAAIAKAWECDSIPSAVLVDHEGVIRRSWVGTGMTPNEVWYAVEQLVADAEKK